MIRDLDVGGTLSRTFAIYGDQASVLLPLAFVVFLFEAVVGALLVSADTSLVFAALLIQIVTSTLYGGMVVELVSDVQDGRRDHSVGSLFRAVTGVVLPLILAGIVVGVLVVVGLALLIVPGLILLTIFAVVAPAIVVERKGVFEAMGRSRELVRGNGLQVFGVIAVVFVITIVVGLLIGGIAGAAGTVGRVIGEVIASTILAPISALAAAVLYFELRRAKGELGAAPAAPGPDGVETGGAAWVGSEPAAGTAPEAPLPGGFAPPTAPTGQPPTEQQPAPGGSSGLASGDPLAPGSSGGLASGDPLAPGPEEPHREDPPRPA